MPFIDKSTLTYPATNSFPIRKWLDVRDPLSSDFKNFKIFDVWINENDMKAFILVQRTATFGTWISIGTSVSEILTITGDVGGAVGSDASNNINLLTGANLTTTGNPGTNTITIDVDSTIADQYDTDSGSAIPAANVLNIFGGIGTSTTGAGNTVTINSTGGGLDCTEITVVGPTQMAIDNCYIANIASPSVVELILPLTAVIGSVIEIIGKGTGGFQINQNAGQTITLVDSVTTTGVGGLVNSSESRSTLLMTCITADTEWQIVASTGNLIFT